MKLPRRSFLHLAASAAALKFSTELRDLRRYVANRPHSWAMLMKFTGWAGTGQPAGMLRGQLFGPEGNITPE